MAIIQCNNHGIQGAALVSSSIRDCILYGNALSPDDIRRVRVNLFDDVGDVTYWIDSATVLSSGVPVDRVLNLDEAEEYERLLDLLEPVCGKCLLAAIDATETDST